MPTTDNHEQNSTIPHIEDDTTLITVFFHLAIWGRPDFAHAVRVLRRYVHNPSQKLWQGYQRVARYFVGTRDYRLVYGHPDPEDMPHLPNGYTDSDWSPDLDNRESPGAYIMFLYVQ